MLLLETSEDLWNGTSGLCGNPNGNPYDDFALPGSGGGSAGTAAELSEAWQHSQCESSSSSSDACAGDEDLSSAATLFCKKLLDLEALDECRKVSLFLQSWERRLASISSVHRF